jgi:hypothetical protein
MAYARDPLSVLYDDDAQVVLDRLYGVPMRGGAARTIAYIASPFLSGADAGGLTAQERAFQRAVYWQLKRRRPSRSIRTDWSDDNVPGLGRPVTITMFTLSAARAWSEKHASSRPRWADDPSLQSGGVGSGKERFPA